MNNVAVLDQLQTCPDLPALPAVSMRILELTRVESAADTRALAGAVSLDPALAARILRLVNSSFYGLSVPISSIHSAVLFLGASAIRSLVIGFSLVPILRARKSRAFDHQTYWRRSLYSATAGRVLGMSVAGAQPEECFLAALMADVGMLACDWLLGEQYTGVVSTTPRHAELPAAEASAFNMTHATASGYLARRWRFPDVLAVPMAHHHDPDTVGDAALRRAARVVALATRCGDLFIDQQPAGAAVAHVRRACGEWFGMQEFACDTILYDVEMQAKQLAPLFEVSIPTGRTIESVLRSVHERAA